MSGDAEGGSAGLFAGIDAARLASSVTALQL